ncbi:MAG: class I SAM-dependent methyltransferase [Magnetococcales bacterium]|nr:class I SAM-dependent methyltransferase [Magnetococcales bacterium]
MNDLPSPHLSAPLATIPGIDPIRHPATCRLLAALLTHWPDHRAYLEKSFACRPVEVLATGETTAGLIERIAGEQLSDFCADYRFKCRLVQMEEIHFRRHGRYRLSTFDEARREVYDNAAFMGRYLNGILMTHLFWSNHATVIHAYREIFLTSNAAGYRHLEVGPGHGLLLHFATNDPRCAHAEGWDISTTSLQATSACLQRFETAHKVQLRQRDLFDPALPARPAFDSIVISEVLEHLEQPRQALEILSAHLLPGGRIFIHVPVNGPSPDHIFLFRSPEEVEEMVRATGLTPVTSRIIPGTGYDLERARRDSLMLSCIVIATR